MANLTTIPPELLLCIISHLPSSSSFFALSQTSTYLRTFFLAHAPTICNTQITTYHSRSSTILLSVHSPAGWLIPTHPCVLAEERRIYRDKILFSGCTCSSCRLFLLSSRAGSSASSLTLSEMSLQAGSCFPYIPHLRPPPSQTVQCKAESEIAKTTKLTVPGPQYLVFLERYGREIEIRDAMRPRGYSASARGKGEGVEDRTQEEKEKSRFDFMVGNYSVRRFLEDAERGMSPRDASSGASGEKEDCDERWVKKSWKEKLRWNGLRRRRMRVVPELQRDVVVECRKQPLMFGEIEKADDEPRRESWMKGLIWYYGPTSAPPTARQLQQPLRKRDKIQAKLEKTKNNFRDTTTRVGSKIGQVLRSMRSGDGFRSLED